MTDPTTTTAAWLERLAQVQDNVRDRLGDDPGACMANVSIDDLIDLVRALAERVAVLEQTPIDGIALDLAIRRHRDTTHLP